MKLVAVLLAAGGGSRFDGPGHKLRTVIDGCELFERSLANVTAAAIGRVIVITGAAELCVAPPALERHNPDWMLGQAGSLQVALAAAVELDAEFVVFGLADQPGIHPSTWRAVADAAAEHLIVVASYDGRRGPHPVRLHRSLWPLLPATGDDGAKQLVRNHPALVHEVVGEGSAFDIDTLEDAQQWKSS